MRGNTCFPVFYLAVKSLRQSVFPVVARNVGSLVTWRGLVRSFGRRIGKGLLHITRTPRRGEKMRPGLFIVLAVLLAVFTAGALHAQTVVIPDKATPEEEVALRKFAMRALNSNLRDIRLKLKKGDSDGLLTPALNISSIAQLLPYAFEKKHESVYPYKGSTRYFKGAAPGEFQANAEYLNAQALKLLRLATAKNMKVLSQQNERIKRACVGCHKKLRGEN